MIDISHLEIEDQPAASMQTMQDFINKVLVRASYSEPLALENFLNQKELSMLPVVCGYYYGSKTPEEFLNDILSNDILSGFTIKRNNAEEMEEKENSSKELELEEDPEDEFGEELGEELEDEYEEEYEEEYFEFEFEEEMEEQELEAFDFSKEHLFYFPPYTLAIWNDGTWTLVKTHNDPFDKEYGYAMAIARKFYGGNRSAFVRDIEEAFCAEKTDVT